MDHPNGVLFDSTQIDSFLISIDDAMDKEFSAISTFLPEVTKKDGNSSFQVLFDFTLHCLQGGIQQGLSPIAMPDPLPRWDRRSHSSDRPSHSRPLPTVRPKGESQVINTDIALPFSRTFRKSHLAPHQFAVFDHIQSQVQCHTHHHRDPPLIAQHFQ